MHKAWGSGRAFTGVLQGQIGQVVDDGLLLGFTVLQDGARNTVMMPKASGRILVVEGLIVIREALPNA